MPVRTIPFPFFAELASPGIPLRARLPRRSYPANRRRSPTCSSRQICRRGRRHPTACEYRWGGDRVALRFRFRDSPPRRLCGTAQRVRARIGSGIGRVALAMPRLVPPLWPRAPPGSAFARALGPAEAALSQRQRADSLAGGRENRIADRRQDRRQRGLAQSGGRVVALIEMDFDGGRRLCEPHHSVLVEVGLLYAAL